MVNDVMDVFLNCLNIQYYLVIVVDVLGKYDEVLDVVSMVEMMSG